MKRPSLRIAVVADTHSRPHPESTRRLRELSPDHILHAGDIGDLEVLDGLAEVAPVTAVRGNIDTHAAALPDVVTVSVEDEVGVLIDLVLLHIAVYGPKLRAEVGRLARKEDASLVVCGHSHVPFIGRDRDITVFNPGSIGPKRFQLPIVFGVIDIDRTRVDIRHLSVETGERWRPGISPS